MLEHRTFRSTEVERDAVNALLAEHTTDGHASVTRSEAQESGPLRVELVAVGRSWLVHADGRVEEETA